MELPCRISGGAFCVLDHTQHSVPAPTLGCVPRHSKKPRQLVADGRVYMWTLRHSHQKDHAGRSVDCRQILTLSPQPSGTGGPLRIVFAEGPGRYVPGGAPFGSGTWASFKART